MIWVDPILPQLNTPTWAELQVSPVRFGEYDAVLTPNQWEFVFADEEYLFWIGGVRSSKTWGGCFRGLRFSLWIPNSRGIVGRLYKSDLERTTQRDFYELATATGRVKSKNDAELIVYCCDPLTGKLLPGKPTSEILFLHLDNVDHIKGHGRNWAALDEGSEVGSRAFYRIADRLSHQGYWLGDKTKPAKKSLFTMSNPEGRNWIWREGYSQDYIMSLSPEVRLKRRAIHSQTKDNPFLPPDYINNLLAIYPTEWVTKYMEGSFDVFEGQIYKEFSYDIHFINSRYCTGWEKDAAGFIPPRSWPRYLGIDTGGADPWAFEFAAVDPYGNVVFCDEIYRTAAYTGEFRKDLQWRMEGLHFAKIPMDYENKEAMEALRHMGIRVTNAVKRDKREGAWNKMARYLHPNEQRAFPEWHPKAGQPGSPGVFFTERVPKYLEELPQQRWRTIQGKDGMQLNEPDPNIPNHAVDAGFYVLRERPEPQKLLKTPFEVIQQAKMDVRSKYYWSQVEYAKQERERARANTYGLVPPPRRERVWIN